MLEYGQTLNMKLFEILFAFFSPNIKKFEQALFAFLL